jgi:hypothetical protein
MPKDDDEDLLNLAGGPDLAMADLVAEGRKFFRNLLEANGSLRLRIAAQDERLARMAEEYAEAKRMAENARRLEHENLELTRELGGMRQRFEEVELEQRDYLEHYRQIEEQYVTVANLYVASYQLHATLRFNEVIKVVKEILANLVGVKKARLYLCTKKNDMLLVAGLDTPRLSVPGEGRERIANDADPILTAALLQGVSYYRQEGAPANISPIVACVPLRIRKQVVGLLVIDELLSQKDGVSSTDSQIFDLLGAHVAVALARSKRTDRLSGSGGEEGALMDHVVNFGELLIVG